MFYGAYAFDQDLCNWEMKSDAVMYDFCTGAVSCGGCTITAFTTKKELKEAVYEYCNNPAEWENNKKFNKYG
jgi:hypothetical protein